MPPGVPLAIALAAVTTDPFRVAVWFHLFLTKVN
jgi:hypothetical protein